MLRELTSRNRGVSIERMTQGTIPLSTGMDRVFREVCETPSVLAGLEQWLRRRLRSAIWKQWKRGSARFAELRHRAVNATWPLKRRAAIMVLGGWRLAYAQHRIAQCLLRLARDSAIDCEAHRL